VPDSSPQLPLRHQQQELEAAQTGPSLNADPLVEMARAARRCSIIRADRLIEMAREAQRTAPHPEFSLVILISVRPQGEISVRRARDARHDANVADMRRSRSTS